MPSFKEVLYSSERKGKLRNLTDDETIRLRQVFLKTYYDVSKVCEKYGLTFMLCGGSVLGAVRHKGFIPWDDDLDAAMIRKEYDVLVSVFDKELGDKYVLTAPNRNGTARNRFPQILVKGTRFVELGSNPNNEMNMIKIDLFIIENYPENKFHRIFRGLRCSFLMLIASSVGAYQSNNKDIEDFLSTSDIGKKFINRRKIIGKLFSFKSKQKWIDSVDNACNYKIETNLKGIPTGRRHYFGEICSSSTFVPAVKVPFEDIEVFIPADSDGYLRNLYGPDYMVLPPEEKREHHAIIDIAFDV